MSVVVPPRSTYRVAPDDGPAGRALKGVYFTTGEHPVKHVWRHGIGLFAGFYDRDQHGVSKSRKVF